jgi:hypothetical protein
LTTPSEIPESLGWFLGYFVAGTYVAFVPFGLLSGLILLCSGICYLVELWCMFCGSAIVVSVVLLAVLYCAWDSPSVALLFSVMLPFPLCVLFDMLCFGC